jgi:microcystin-dependent protein
MGTPFIGQLMPISWNYAPKNWAFCNGQFLPINQNQALFSLLGTQYGGDGRTTFALPDLRGRTPIHGGPGLTIGENLGEEFHTLSVNEMPAHDHQFMASASDANQPAPNMLAAANNLYHGPTSLTSMRPGTLTNFGGGQAHENRQPFLVVNWCIALVGIFPSRS